VFNISFRERKSTVTYYFYKRVEFSIKFPAIYVNKKKICRKFKKTLDHKNAKQPIRVHHFYHVTINYPIIINFKKRD